MQQLALPLLLRILRWRVLIVSLAPEERKWWKKDCEECYQWLLKWSRKFECNIVKLSLSKYCFKEYYFAEVGCSPPTHNPMMGGWNPATGTSREKMMKERCWRMYLWHLKLTSKFEWNILKLSLSKYCWKNVSSQ